MASRPPRDRPAILVVDDDPDVRTILSILLSHNGYEVITAGDGATALELAPVRRVGLIVIDLRMPRLRGDGFCDKYREHGGDAPIVLVTAAQGRFGDRGALRGRCLHRKAVPGRAGARGGRAAGRLALIGPISRPVPGAA